MIEDTQLVASKLRHWNDYMSNYQLPTWEEIPNIGLYMEQVIQLLNDYLNYLAPEIKDEQYISASTVNNYVRLEIVPMPTKKKYYRMHIAFLLIVLSMKNGVTLGLIQKYIPSTLSEKEIEERYKNYYVLHRKACKYFVNEIIRNCQPIVSLNNPPAKEEPQDALELDSSESVVAWSAIISGFTKILTEKLLLLV